MLRDSDQAAGAAPEDRADWSLASVHPGDLVELSLYGDRLNGVVRTVGADQVGVTVRKPAAVLTLATVYGTAAFPLPGGAASVPVSVRGTGDVLQVQVIGEATVVQRREHPRAEIELPVRLMWPTARVGAWQRAVSHSVDLSRGGMLVAPAMVVWPSAGTRVVLSIDVEPPLQVHAEVVGKTADYGLRLRFSDLDAASMTRIDALIG